MNIVNLAVIAVLVLCAVTGMRKGMVRKLSGIISIVLSTMLVSAILPSVTGIIKEKTPVYELVVAQCETLMGNSIANSITTHLAGGSGNKLDRNAIREVMDYYGMDTSMLDVMSDNEITTMVETYLPDYTDRLLSGESKALDGLSRIEQTRLIQSLPLPEFMQKLLLNYNNSEGYKTLGADSFGEYIIRFIANVILNIVSFIATLILVHIIVRLLLNMLDLFAKFPILYSVNHIGGLVVGILEGVLIVWFGMLIMSMFSGTTVGITLMDQANSGWLTRIFYDNNVFLEIVTRSIESIM